MKALLDTIPTDLNRSRPKVGVPTKPTLRTHDFWSFSGIDLALKDHKIWGEIEVGPEIIEDFLRSANKCHWFAFCYTSQGRHCFVSAQWKYSNPTLDTGKWELDEKTPKLMGEFPDGVLLVVPAN